MMEDLGRRIAGATNTFNGPAQVDTSGARKALEAAIRRPS
jgi:hypothetical protein